MHSRSDAKSPDLSMLPPEARTSDKGSAPVKDDGIGRPHANFAELNSSRAIRVSSSPPDLIYTLHCYVAVFDNLHLFKQKRRNSALHFENVILPLSKIVCFFSILENYFYTKKIFNEQLFFPYANNVL